MSQCPRCKSDEAEPTSEPKWGFTESTYEKWQTFFCPNCHQPFSVILEKVEKDPTRPEYVAPDGRILAMAVDPTKLGKA